MRIYLTGSGGFGVTTAEAITEAGHTIVGTASPALKRGRSDDTDPAGWDRLRAWAYPRRVPWTEARGLRAHHVPDGTDLIVAAHSHAFVGRNTRQRARHGAIGYHPSLLPLHRGRDAIKWTIRDGDRVTGGTVYRLTERTDAGPICAQEHVLVPPGSTATSLWRDHLAPLGVRLLLHVIGQLERGVRVEVPQDEKLATWEPAMDAAPLFKPELPEIAAPGGDTVLGHREALWSA